MRFATTPSPISILRATGFSYDIWPQAGVAVSFGARIEGIPAYDLIGGDMGFRRPGYTVSLEAGAFRGPAEMPSPASPSPWPFIATGSKARRRKRLGRPDGRCCFRRLFHPGEASVTAFRISCWGNGSPRPPTNDGGRAGGRGLHSLSSGGVAAPTSSASSPSLRPFSPGRSSARPRRNCAGTAGPSSAIAPARRSRRVAWEHRCERRIRHGRRGVVRTGIRGSRSVFQSRRFSSPPP